MVFVVFIILEICWFEKNEGNIEWGGEVVDCYIYVYGLNLFCFVDVICDEVFFFLFIGSDFLLIGGILEVRIDFVLWFFRRWDDRYIY